jgi:hypothetical protein
MRTSISWIALTLTFMGCGREVIDHTSPAATGGSTSGAEAGVSGDCSALAEGASCDDGDVCTPGSVCRGGVCFGENPMTTCVVADTEADFGETQGSKGWHYGYWDVSMDPDGHFDAADLRLMEFCGSGTWKPPGRCAAQPEQPDYQWTSILCCGLQHPESDPILELPVRRWVSDVSGPARIHAKHRMKVGTGDGTRAILMVDGDTVWTNDLSTPSQEDASVEADIDVTLREGTRVEQLVHPHASSAEDTTFFVIQIEGR